MSNIRGINQIWVHWHNKMWFNHCIFQLWTSAFGQDGVTRTGFTFPTWTTKKPERYTERWFSNTGWQAAQDSEAWERENNWAEPCDGPLPPGESLQPGLGSQDWAPRRAEELSWELDVAKAAWSCGAETCTESSRNLQRAPPNLHVNTGQSACVRKLPKVGRRAPASNTRNNTWSSPYRVIVMYFPFQKLWNAICPNSVKNFFIYVHEGCLVVVFSPNNTFFRFGIRMISAL